MESSTSSHRKPRLPVDHGWAWWVMVGYFINLYIVISWIRSLAILLPIFLDKYQQSTAMTTLAFGISELVESVSHVLLSLFLINRFSVRTLTLFGAIANVFAIFSLYLSSNIFLLNVSFGVIGFARGFLLNPQIFLLGAYFKKRLSFASSMGNTGTSVATLTSPLLTQLLLTSYGLDATFLLFAAIATHSIVSSLLFRPTTLYSESKNEISNDASDFYENQIEDHSNAFAPLSTSFSASLTSLKLHTPNTLIDKPSKVVTVRNPEYAMLVPVNVDSDDTYEDKEDCCQVGEMITGHHYSRRIDHVTRVNSMESKHSDPVHFQNVHNIHDRVTINSKDHGDTLPSNNKLDERDNEFSSNSNTNTCKSSEGDQEKQLQNILDNNSNTVYDKCLSEHNNYSNASVECIAGECNSIHNITTEISNTLSSTPKSEGGTDESSRREKTPNDQKQTVTVWEVMRNPTAMFVILAGVFGVQTQCGAVYLPVLGLENGLESEQLPWLLTIGGSSDIVGKLIFGFVADRRWIHPINIACLCMFNGGLVFQLVSYFQGLGPMISLSILFGLNAGMMQALVAPITVEYVGLPSLPHITSGVFLGNCILTFVAHLVVGTLKDHTGSFKWGFRFVGALMLMAVVFLIIARWCSARGQRSFRRKFESKK